MKSLLQLSLVRYMVSIASVGCALLAARLLPSMEQAHAVFLLGAVAFSAWFGGMTAGLLATALAAVVLASLLSPAALPPGGALGETMEIAAFVLVAVLLGSLHAAQRYGKESLSRRDRRRKEFLAVIAHELRNCLAPLSLSFHAFRARALDPALLERSQETAERQLANMTRLVNDLMDLSRIDQGKVRLHKVAVDLPRVVRHAVETTRPLLGERGHQVDLSLPAGPMWGEVDPMRLEQVVVNLVTNAAKFTEPGGRIGIAVEPAGSEVRIRVRDTGVGFSDQMKPRLFDLFAQAENGKRGGLGVGLHLAYRLIRLHGGELTAHSDGPGRGSEFVIRLPLTEKPTQEMGMRHDRSCSEMLV